MKAASYLTGQNRSVGGFCSPGGRTLLPPLQEKELASFVCRWIAGKYSKQWAWNKETGAQMICGGSCWQSSRTPACQATPCLALFTHRSRYLLCGTHWLFLHCTFIQLLPFDLSKTTRAAYWKKKTLQALWTFPALSFLSILHDFHYVLHLSVITRNPAAHVAPWCREWRLNGRLGGGYYKQCVRSHRCSAGQAGREQQQHTHTGAVCWKSPQNLLTSALLLSSHTHTHTQQKRQDTHLQTQTSSSSDVFLVRVWYPLDMEYYSGNVWHVNCRWVTDKLCYI